MFYSTVAAKLAVIAAMSALMAVFFGVTGVEPWATVIALLGFFGFGAGAGMCEESERLKLGVR